MSKSCPACGPVLKSRTVAHYVDVFYGVAGLVLLTLTLPPELRIAPRSRRAYLVSLCFRDRLRRRLRRMCEKTDDRLRYVGGFEWPAGSSPHIHLLVACQADERELREAVYGSGFGVVVGVDPVAPDRESVARTVGYVLKGPFGDPERSGSVLSSRSDGYYSMDARLARLAVATAGIEKTDGETILVPQQDRTPRRGGRARVEVPDFSGVNLGQRRRKYIDRTEDGRHGIRHRFDDTGRFWADVVKIDNRDVINVAIGFESLDDARTELSRLGATD